MKLDNYNILYGVASKAKYRDNYFHLTIKDDPTLVCDSMLRLIIYESFKFYLTTEQYYKLKICKKCINKLPPEIKKEVIHQLIILKLKS